MRRMIDHRVAPYLAGLAWLALTIAYAVIW
jgi:hypothetical protein